MFERFSDNARAVVIHAQDYARGLGHRYIGCEHLLLAVASTGEPASAVLHEHGVTPEAVTTEIVRFIGRGPSAELFTAADHNALAAIGIDLDAVRVRIEEVFGPGAFRRAMPDACRSRWPSWRNGSPAQLLRRRRRCRAGRAVALPQAVAAHPAGRIPFTPRAKKGLEHSWREAKARHDNYIGVEHLTLALVAMTDGAVPPILAALGASQPALRAAILDRYRRAS
jgi:ATP-dependent Clp protease ATP-binding subunit ClpA